MPDERRVEESIFMALRPPQPPPAREHEAPSVPASRPGENAAAGPSANAGPEGARPPGAAEQARLLERIEKLEARLAQKAAEEHGASGRAEVLERQLEDAQKKLKEAVETAARSSAALAEREAARVAAQRETEAVLKEVAAARRSEEIDRQTREQLAAQRRRIDELEARLLAALDESRKSSEERDSSQEKLSGAQTAAAERLRRELSDETAKALPRLRRELAEESVRGQVEAAKVLAEVSVASLRAEVRESLSRSAESLSERTAKLIESELSSRETGLRREIRESHEALASKIEASARQAGEAAASRFEGLEKRVRQQAQAQDEPLRLAKADLARLEACWKETLASIDSLAGRVAAAQASAAGAREEAAQVVRQAVGAIRQEASAQVREEAGRVLDMAVAEAVLRIRKDSTEEVLALVRAEAVAALLQHREGEAARHAMVERRFDQGAAAVESLKARLPALEEALKAGMERFEERAGNAALACGNLAPRLEAMERRCDDLRGLEAGTRQLVKETRSFLEKGLAGAEDKMRRLSASLGGLKALLRGVLLDRLEDKGPRPDDRLENEED